MSSIPARELGGEALALPICSKVPLPLDNWQGCLIVGCMLVYDGLMIWGLLRLIVVERNWRPIWPTVITFLVMFAFVSPGPLVMASWAREGRPPWVVLSPGHQSWAFLADVALDGVVALRAFATYRLPLNAMYPDRAERELRLRRGGIAVSVVLGVAVAALFRFHEAGAYDLLRYDSLPKQAHDVMGYVILAVLLIYALSSLIWHFVRNDIAIWMGVPAFALAAVWVFVSLVEVHAPPDPNQLHRPAIVSAWERPATPAEIATQDVWPASRACR